MGPVIALTRRPRAGDVISFPSMAYASWRVRPSKEQSDPYGDLLYQGTIWHCAQCAGWDGALLWSCDHPHKSRETALDCAKQEQEKYSVQNR